MIQSATISNQGFNGVDVVTIDIGERYIPLSPPCADNNDLAIFGRVIVYHRPNCNEIEIKLIPPGDIYAGLVVGTFKR